MIKFSSFNAISISGFRKPIRTLILLALCSFLCFSCSQKPAKVIDLSRAKYGKSSTQNRQKYKNLSQKNSKKLDQNFGVNFDEKAREESRTNSASDHEIKDKIEVLEGETLYGIAKKNSVSTRELIEVNNLKAPYIVKAKTILKLPAPRFHEVRDGETIYSVARSKAMKVDDLILINNLKFPFVIHPGDTLKIHGFDQNNSTQNQSAQAQEDEFLRNQNSTKKDLPEKNSAKKPEFAADKAKLATKQQSKREQNSDEPGFIDRSIDKNSHFSWPLYGKIISNFGPKSGGLYNDGINIQADAGEAVRVAQEGTVAYVGNELKGYGNLIIVKHADGWLTAYAHLKNSSVNKGQKVKKGQKIGLVGSTGKVAFPQLYFGLRRGNDAVNPENYLHKARF